MAIHLGKDLIQQMNTLRVQPGCLAIWSLGQMGVVLKGSSQKIVYIDPILTDVVTRKLPEFVGRMERAFTAPLNPQDITNADYVFCTHEHYDHTDPYTLGPLAVASPLAQFYTSAWSAESLDEAGIALARRHVPMPGRALELDGLTIHAIPAAHYQVETDAQKGSRWMSLLLDWGDVAFFHSGDTILYPGYIEAIRALPGADVGLLAANGRDFVRDAQDVKGNLLPSEAAWMADELGWDVLLGGHNDLFTINTIPAGDLLDAVQKQNPRLKAHCLRPAELFYYVR